MLSNTAQVTFLAALLAAVSAIALALVHISVPTKDGHRWRNLLLQVIPSTIAVLLSYVAVYVVFISHGIQLVSSAGPDSKEIARIVEESLDKRLNHAEHTRITSRSDAEPMRKIQSEYPRVIDSVVPAEALESLHLGSPSGRRDVLIVVDVQKDFFDGGQLPVTDASSLLPPLNSAIAAAERAGVLIIFTQDWHPDGHGSFKGHGGRFPRHCVGGTDGAKLHPDLKLPMHHETVKFGTDALKAGYSPFENPELIRLVKDEGIGDIFVVGIATEYCVLATCKAAKELGKSVTVIEPLVRAATPDELEETWARYDEHRIRRIQRVPWTK